MSVGVSAQSTAVKALSDGPRTVIQIVPAVTLSVGDGKLPSISRKLLESLTATWRSSDKPLGWGLVGSLAWRPQVEALGGGHDMVTSGCGKDCADCVDWVDLGDYKTLTHLIPEPYHRGRRLSSAGPTNVFRRLRNLFRGYLLPKGVAV